MKTLLNIFAFLVLVPAGALAQGGLEGDVDSELDQLYSSSVQEREVAPAPKTRARIQNNAPVSGGQPIYILNQAPNSASQNQAGQTQVVAPAPFPVQKQPTTFVEASPLSESQAERMRKARQDAELHTETKIVEKLETSRMDDEKRRAQILFGDKFDRLAGQNQEPTAPAQVSAAPPAAPVPPPAVVTAQPAPPVQVQLIAPAPAEEKEHESTRDIIREELQSAMQVEKELPPQIIEQKYFGAILGTGEYQDVQNVEWNYSFGFTFGTKYDDTYSLEGTFLYSNYTIRSPGSYYGGGYYPSINYLDDVNKYSGSIAMKYYLFSGMVRPVVGGLVEYSYRTHTPSVSGPFAPIGVQPNRVEVNSHAIDLGAIVGADIEFSKKVSLGIDFRYLFNLSSRINNSPGAYFTPGALTEKLNHYVFTMTGRATF